MPKPKKKQQKQQSKGKARAKPPTASKKSAKSEARARNTEVEQRWNEYWRRRKELEAAVVKVRDASESLNQAREAEQTLRREFEETKRSLKELLDVEPATTSSPLGGSLDSSADELN